MPRTAPTSSAGRSSQTTRQLFVWVAIRAPELLLGEDDGLMPTLREVPLADQVLASVLWSLFANGAAVGLRRSLYW